ncbi:putative ankyrin repeat protein RF_0381, partial [Saccostrea cucullata]|uniref:putative ankyrin repeat protein RF_0381 n=1 Tax=Saccostrea cuccullata TaxID=36930 RepID=UPI002ED16414
MLHSYKEEIGNLFVRTRAVSKAMDLLKTKGYVFLKGNPGDGKTTLSKHILNELQSKEGMRPLQIFSVKTLYETIPTCSNLAIFLDNLFGEITLEDQELHVYEKQQHVIKETVNDNNVNGNKLIVTIRNDIYSECLGIMKESSFFNNSFVDLSTGEYSLNLKELETFVTKYNLEQFLSGNILQEVLNLGKSIGMPQCLKLMKESTRIENIESVFTDPYKHLNKEIRRRIEKGEPKTAVLVYILLHGGRVNNDLVRNPAHDKELKLKAMEIVDIKNKTLWEFQNCIDLYEGLDDHGQSMLVHFAEFGNLQLVNLLLPSSSAEQKYISLNKASAKDHLEVVDFILRKDSVFDMKTCFFAVQSGNIEMVLRFARKMHLKQRAFSNHARWANIRGGLLHEVIFFGQNHLIQPLLQEFPDLASVVNSTGGSALHFVAFAGEKEVFTFLVQNGCDPYCRTSHGTTVLHYACQNGKLNMVEHLYEKYHILFTSEYNDFEGQSCQNWAAQSGNLELYEYLLNKNVKYNDDSNTPLHMACQSGQYEMFKYLLEKHPEALSIKNREGYAVLHYVANGGNIQILKLLLERNVQIDELTDDDKTVLHVASSFRQFELVQYLVNEHSFLLHKKDKKGESALHCAAWGGNLDLFKYLIEKGLKVKCKTSNEQTVLHMCCKNGKVEIVKYLMYNYPDLFPLKDEDGVTALHEMARSGEFSGFRFLFQSCKEVDPYIKTKSGRSLLHFASQGQDKDTVKFLLESYPQLRCERNENEYTVLHDSVIGGNEEIFRYLISKGLAIGDVTKEGKSVLHLAVEYGHIDLCKFIVEHEQNLLDLEDRD